ncbi:GNAT family N-acetyltransferase [Streptomyces sp. NBC_00264]|uniref:GNAT family N-acetyltransferase n=1 Tax=Streptomyces sanglieri TaxID=193460 RepID=A0ABW2WLS9_9ACTN|nr:MULTISPECIES: GNAT family N-acetyltransferase [unclassified Streptomyces]WSG48383.1 GNAT family N-acetyltransferase [Streptomyces sp. NBC_01732]WSW99032.1 GNAT family N-acetyltransferase [Streptomyces sp. NBC_00987]MCX5166324.1 GNAT family N-acetyltransferase [Streptomyces sp. NBC_00305]MCX5224841.1 GNAT family N-acetyltransferase [Streptomyces sp. NBC_00264]RPK53992.1 Acetyltransferase (GNAT) family protein [Streptomyces sp. ADI95-17]
MTGQRHAATESHRPFAEPVRLDLSDPDTLRHLWDLQRASYAVEARLIGFDGIPPLHESLEQLRTCDESCLGVRDELRLVGAVAWTRLPNGALDICRLVVHPVAHRRGVATALLDALDLIEPAELTVVSTATANLPAVALYRRRGFIPVGERQVAPGVTITLLERKNASASQPIHNS